MKRSSLQKNSNLSRTFASDKNSVARSHSEKEITVLPHGQRAQSSNERRRNKFVCICTRSQVTYASLERATPGTHRRKLPAAAATKRDCKLKTRPAGNCWPCTRLLRLRSHHHYQPLEQQYITHRPAAGHRRAKATEPAGTPCPLDSSVN